MTILISSAEHLAIVARLKTEIENLKNNKSIFDEMLLLEKSLTDKQRLRQISIITGFPPTPLGFPQFTQFQMFRFANATPEQRIEAAKIILSHD